MSQTPLTDAAQTSRAYFVTYILTMGAQKIGPTNIILRGVHPVVWAANPPKVATMAGHVTRLIFYAECDPALGDDQTVRRWCGVEDV